MAFAALLDSCVLYPRILRDTLLRLAEDPVNLFRPYFSHSILDAVSRNLIKNGRMDEQQAAYLKDAMLKAFPEALVEDIPDGLEGILRNDPGDRHVLATAIKASTAFEKINWIVTSNLKDFKPVDLASWGIEAISPDDFLLELCDEYSTDRIISVLEVQAASFQNPISFLELSKRLEKQCPKFISQVLLKRYGFQIYGTLLSIINTCALHELEEKSPWLTNSYKIYRELDVLKVSRREGGFDIFEATSVQEINGTLAALDVEKFINPQIHEIIEKAKNSSQLEFFRRSLIQPNN